MKIVGGIFTFQRCLIATPANVAFISGTRRLSTELTPLEKSSSISEKTLTEQHKNLDEFREYKVIYLSKWKKVPFKLGRKKHLVFIISYSNLDDLSFSVVKNSRKMPWISKRSKQRTFSPTNSSPSFTQSRCDT